MAGQVSPEQSPTAPEKATVSGKTTSPDMRERHLDHVMAEIFMSDHPASMSKADLKQRSEELKQYGFGDLALTVEKDGHHVDITRADGKKFVFNESGMQLTDSETHKAAELNQLTEPVKANSKEAANKKDANVPESDESKPVSSGRKHNVVTTNQSITPTNESQTVAYGREDRSISATYDKDSAIAIPPNDPRYRNVGADGVISQTVTAEQNWGGTGLQESFSVDNPQVRSGFVAVSQDIPGVGGTASYGRGNYMHEVGYSRDFGDNTSVNFTDDIFNKRPVCEVSQKLSKRVSLKLGVVPHDRLGPKPQTSVVGGVNIRLGGDGND